VTPTEGEPFFISTAIPYVNARPHVGFAFEAVLTDAIARYRRARGRDVFFLTGTDDNSLKNVEAAEERGMPIETLVDENATRFHALKESLELSFDDFIRTSRDPRHRTAVEKLWVAKEESVETRRRVSTILYNLAEVLRIVAAFSAPFIPAAAERIANQLALEDGWQDISEATASWGGTVPGTAVHMAPALFPKG